MNPVALAPHIRETIATMGPGSVSRSSGSSPRRPRVSRSSSLRTSGIPRSLKCGNRRTVRAGRGAGAEWEKYKTSLVTKYVKIHEKTVKGLDYEKSIKKFPELLKDKRAVADIKGEKRSPSAT